MVAELPGLFLCLEITLWASERAAAVRTHRIRPGGCDFSYVHRSAGPPTNWRIDHAFASPALAGSVRGCSYSHTERENRLSDHSMLLVDID